jgi:hypothetical protein
MERWSQFWYCLQRWDNVCFGLHVGDDSSFFQFIVAHIDWHPYLSGSNMTMWLIESSYTIYKGNSLFDESHHNTCPGYDLVCSFWVACAGFQLGYFMMSVLSITVSGEQRKWKDHGVALPTQKVPTIPFIPQWLDTRNHVVIPIGKSCHLLVVLYTVLLEPCIWLETVFSCIISPLVIAECAY